MIKNKTLFDIKRVNESGVVEVQLASVLDLKIGKEIQRTQNHKSELENILNGNFDFKAELAKAGAKVNNLDIEPARLVDIDYNKILSEINRSSFHNLVSRNYQQSEVETKSPLNNKEAEAIKNVVHYRFGKILFLPLVITIGFFIWRYGLTIRNNIIQNGNSAVFNLQEAKTNLEELNFSEALKNFSNAYNEFSKTGDSLNFMGSFISGFLAEIPGNSQYKSARKLVEAGKLFSKSGESLASVVNSISKAGSILNPNNSSLGLVSNLKKALLQSRANIQKASALLAEIDSEIIPEDKQASFLEFKDKLPEIVELVDRGIDYSRFLESFIATGNSKKYIILFQNPSELRPTGGFPGSYGVLYFKNGKLDEFKVDDIYNLDGQLKENIIPPKELQHITPTWASRDANWFIDFPTSAKKIMQFFKKEAGYEVDGVITFNPLLVGEMLKVLGPVQMPEYGLVLDQNNFLAEIQAEVEYGENRVQPKTILVQFAPRLLEKIYSAESSKWLEIFNVLVSGMENKNILMYFDESSLQNFALGQNFTGEIKNIADSDYLYATITNIKGSKTDIVTDTLLKVDSDIKNGEVTHEVTITRKHNGGKEKFGFYNKPNPAYVRVLVPQESEFMDISGNSLVNYKPLVNYGDVGFIEDLDLKKLESSAKMVEEDVFEYEEHGKKGFGFWLVADPGETETVTLRYKTPINEDNYRLYIQKQPGLKIQNMDLKFDINGRTIRKAMPLNTDLDLKLDLD